MGRLWVAGAVNPASRKRDTETYATLALNEGSIQADSYAIDVRQ